MASPGVATIKYHNLSLAHRGRGNAFEQKQQQVVQRATSFLRYSKATVSDPIWLKFELIQDIMHVLITCKYKKDQINSNREKMETYFFSHSRTANSVVSSGICPKFELIQTFMYILITCKNEKDKIENQPRKRDDDVRPQL